MDIHPAQPIPSNHHPPAFSLSRTKLRRRRRKKVAQFQFMPPAKPTILEIITALASEEKNKLAHYPQHSLRCCFEIVIILKCAVQVTGRPLAGWQIQTTETVSGRKGADSRGGRKKLFLQETFAGDAPQNKTSTFNPFLRRQLFPSDDLLIILTFNSM